MGVGGTVTELTHLFLHHQVASLLNEYFGALKDEASEALAWGAEFKGYPKTSLSR